MQGGLQGSGTKMERVSSIDRDQPEGSTPQNCEVLRMMVRIRYKIRLTSGSFTGARIKAKVERREIGITTIPNSEEACVFCRGFS